MMKLDPQDVSFSNHAIARCFAENVNPDDILIGLSLGHFTQPQTEGRTAHYFTLNGSMLQVVTGNQGGYNTDTVVITVVVGESVSPVREPRDAVEAAGNGRQS